MVSNSYSFHKEDEQNWMVYITRHQEKIGSPKTNSACGAA